MKLLQNNETDNNKTNDIKAKSALPQQESIAQSGMSAVTWAGDALMALLSGRPVPDANGPTRLIAIGGVVVLLTLLLFRGTIVLDVALFVMLFGAIYLVGRGLILRDRNAYANGLIIVVVGTVGSLMSAKASLGVNFALLGILSIIATLVFKGLRKAPRSNAMPAGIESKLVMGRLKQSLLISAIVLVICLASDVFSSFAHPWVLSHLTAFIVGTLNSFRLPQLPLASVISNALSIAIMLLVLQGLWIFLGMALVYGILASG